MWRCVVLTLVCAGCVNPDDIIPVHGSVASVDSVEGQVVRLLRAAFQAGPYFNPGCELAEPFKETQADADGGYGFEVFRVETRRAGDIDVHCFRVEAGFPSGSVAWSDFTFSSKIRMAPLHDWRAAPSIDGGVLHFEPPVAWPDDLPPVWVNNRLIVGVQLTHREQLVTADGGIAWQADDRFQLPDASVYPYEYAREPLLMDALRLEDFEGTLRLSASLDDAEQETGLDYLYSEPITRMRAGEQLSVRGTRVPLSRGLPCPELGTPCPLTDRELTAVDAGFINEVTLNLLTPAMVSAVVIRGATVGDGLIRVVLAAEDGGIAAEVERSVPFSGFGPSWGPAIRLPDGGYGQLRLVYAVIPLDAGTPSSRVILQFPAGLARIQEISVFEQ